MLEQRLGIKEVTLSHQTSRTSLAAALNASSSHLALGVLGATKSEQKLLMPELLKLDMNLKKILMNVFKKDEEFEIAMKVRKKILAWMIIFVCLFRIHGKHL